MIYKPLNTVLKFYLHHRFKRIESVRNNSVGLQSTVKEALWNKLKNTKYVSDFGAKSINELPVVEYEEIKPYIESAMNGEPDVLWPGITNWYSKSSGTTSDRSKYIPVTDELFYQNMISSSWDTTSIIYNQWKDATLFSAKSLIMGGSLSSYTGRSGVNIGDVSAIMIKRIPAIGKPFYAPDTEIAMIDEWEEKINRIIDTCLHENVVMFGGVPTWNIVLFDRILEQTGKSSILEVWPNLKVYVHGGVSFDPYREKFKKYLPIEDFHYVEIYNASEGYFGVQDSEKAGMLLLTDANIYYEFVPLEYIHDPYDYVVDINGVEPFVTYAIMITTAGGLMRYMPGDTIQFDSVNPYRFKIVGRTAQYINTFGEEVMVHNTDAAVARACKETASSIVEYTVAPRYFDGGDQAGHQWIIEFESQPDHIDKFVQLLDEELRKVNSDYDAKRFKDLALKPLSVIVAPPGSFRRWYEKKNKLGGQHKVPRLSNTRKYVEEIIEIINN